MPNTAPTLELLRNQFDHRSANYDQIYRCAEVTSLWHHEKHRRADWTIDWLARQGCLPSQSSILDAGCGDGFVTCRIAKLENVSHVLGVDLSHKMIESAKRRRDATQVNHSVAFQDGQVESVTGCWNAIVTLGVLGYQPQPLEYARNLAQRLAPGGWLVVSCGNPWSILRQLRTVGRSLQFSWTRKYPQAFKSTSLKQLDRVLKKQNCNRSACRSMSYGIGSKYVGHNVENSRRLEDRDMARNRRSVWLAQSYWIVYQKQN